MGIGNPVHLIFIAAIALIVLGPKRLPELARSLGHGMREFRQSMSDAAGDGEPADPQVPVPGQAQLMASSESTQTPSSPSPATSPSVTAGSTPAVMEQVPPGGVPSPPADPQ